MKRLTPQGREEPVSGPALAAEMAFWDCRLTRLEIVVLALAAGLIGTLNLNPVLQRTESQVLIWLLAAASWLTPMTGMMYAAASQYLPYPEGSLFNPAQVGFLTWAVVAPFRYRRLRFRGAGWLGHFLPFAVWISITTGQFLAGMRDEYSKAIGYALLACQLANEAQGRYLKMLLGLGIGSFGVAAAYWSYVAGLPVTLSEWGAPRHGVARLGGVRADAVMVWPSLLFAFAVALGVAAALSRSPRPRPESRWLYPFAAAVLVAGLPVLISTMTTGGYVGFFALAGAFGVLRAICLPPVRGDSARSPKVVLYTLLASAALAALVYSNAFGLRGRLQAMWLHQREVAERQSLVASRESVWQAALTTIARHPWTGASFSGDEEELPAGLYRRMGVYLAHNVFLDVGRGGGIPAILLFAWFFFYPFAAALRRPRRAKFFPFLLLHVAFVVFFMGLSFQFFKTVWAGWMLMAMAVRADAAASSSARRGPRREAPP